MLHLYFGADDFRMREAYRELRESLDSDGMLETNTTLLPARGLRPQELMQHAATVPFLAQARMVVVEGLLGSLGGGKKVVRDWQPLLDFLPQLPPTNHVMLLETLATRQEGIDLGRSALMPALRKVQHADVREFRELRSRGRGGNEVAVWLRERTQARGVEIEPAAVEELIELVGANLWALSAEIDKLASYASGRPVTADDVRLLTPQALPPAIFDIVDAVVEGRAAPALLLIHRMLEDDREAPRHIQAMISRQLRHLIRATELLEQHTDETAIGEATRVRHPYALSQLTRQARSTTRAVCEAALREVEASDHAVKTGRLDAALALELLVTRLAALARPPATAAASAGS